MDTDWAGYYSESPHWWSHWEECTTPGEEWPPDYSVRQGKLDEGEKLCIPEDLVLEMVRNYHFLNGHLSPAKMAKALPYRYALPPLEPGNSLMSMAELVKGGCVVCQASDQPTFQIKGKYKFTPIPEAPMISVCLDVFSMPPVQWQANFYDCMLVCVDRHSG